MGVPPPKAGEHPPIAIHKNNLSLDKGCKMKIGDDKNAKYRSTRINGKSI